MKHTKSQEKRIKIINRVSKFVAMAAALFALVVASYAWFVNVQEPRSSGITSDAEIYPNLLIASTAEEIKTLQVSDNSFKVDFDTSAGKAYMLPATHDWTVGTETGLKYPENSRYISVDTGLIKDAKLDYGFKPVPKSDNTRYYVDYDAYIATSTEPLTNVTMTAKIIATPTMSSPQLKQCHNAVSVDFYKDSVTSGNFIGTMNIANSQTQQLPISLTEDTIPLNTQSSIHLVLRCYFDGALTDTQGNAYVKSADVSTDGVSFTVSFGVADKQN